MHAFESGFAVRKPSWHALENLLQEPPKDLNEALPIAFPRRDGKPGHWEPMAEPVYVKHLAMSDDGEPVETYHLLDGFKAITRDDDGTPLSVPRSTYEIIGNRAMGEIVEALADEGAEFDTMGAVKEGAQVFCTMMLPEPLDIAGDDTPSWPFFNINTSHDGSTACRAGYGVIRQVCANTVMLTNLKWDSGELPSFTFKHTAGVTERLEEAKAVLATGRQAFSAFVELSAELAKLPCDEEALSDFLAGFIPEPEAKDAITDRQKSNIARDRGKVRALYEESVTTEAHRGTALGLVESAVEYLDHYRQHRTQETLVRRTLMDANDFKSAAISLAREVCTN